MTSLLLPLNQSQIDQFQACLLAWFDKHGRHDLPWQENKTPYRVWISEIMLQQTQVKTVIPYYQKFMTSFPTLSELANATQDEVLSHWSGLGYYSRARNLHKTAMIAQNEFNGDLPDNLDDMMSLPGIGRSTAGAILAISRRMRTPIQDGNVRRVLSRLFTIEGDLTKANNQKQLWELADTLTPEKRVDDYTQAIMDLGATLCTRTNPDCSKCPFIKSCNAYLQDRVTEFPNKKPKKSTPLKTEYFLFWYDSDQLLMEKRPQTGIWGGLWAPPSYVSKEEVLNRLNGTKSTFRAPYRHVFSHYKLDIVPVVVHSPKPTAVADSNSRWLPADDWLKAGLPTPIKKIIDSMGTSPNTGPDIGITND